MLSCEATQTRVALAALLAALLATAAVLGLVGLWLSDGGPLGTAASLPVAAAASASLVVLLLVVAWWLGTVRWLRRDRSHLLRSTFTRHLYGIFGDEQTGSSAARARVDVQAMDEEAALGAQEYCRGLAEMCCCCCACDEDGAGGEEAPLLSGGQRGNAPDDTDAVLRIRNSVRELRAAAQAGDTATVLHLLDNLAQEPMTVDILQKTGERARCCGMPAVGLGETNAPLIFHPFLPQGVGIMVNFLQGPVEEPAQRLIASWRKLTAPDAPATLPRGKSGV